VALAALAVTLVGTAPARAASTPHVVTIVAFSYKPAMVTVKRGDSIRFVNLDIAILQSHTASYPVGCHTGSTCVWTTPILSPTKPTATVQINLTPGTYAFYCQIHPQIRGTVKVT
jgi:plastocyanin